MTDTNELHMPETSDEFERQLFKVIRQAFDDAKIIGTGWVRFECKENGMFSVEASDPTAVCLVENTCDGDVEATDTNQLIERLQEYAAMPPDERARGKILSILATCGASADALAAQQKRIEELEDLLQDAVEDETEFETDWNKAARAALAGKGGTG